jgi:phage FluMu gp28-like protein
MTTAAVNLKKYFLPYQERFIQDRHPHVLRRKSRRCGITYACAFKDVRQRVEQCEKALPPLDCWFTSQDLDTAKEYIRDCRRWLKLYEAVQAKIDEQWMEVEERDAETGRVATIQVRTFVVEFPNGARITALSSNPNALHGKGGDVRIDEWAWHKKGGAIYDEAGPCIRWGGGQLIAFSNPSVEGTPFDAECAKAKAERVLPPEQRFWSYEEITILDAIREGLVEKIRRLRRPATEEEKQAFLAECRAECRTEEAWLRNYMCTSASASASYLPFDLLGACESDRASETWADAPVNFGTLYAGIDIGRTHDLTVMWIAEMLGDVLWTRAILALRGVAFRRQLDTFVDLAARGRIARIAIDAGGIGMNLAEDLARRLGDGRVDQVHLGTSVQEDLAARLLGRFQDRTIRIPVSGTLKDDLLGVRRIDLAGGGVRLETIRTAEGHADRFWAAALLCRAAQTGADCGPIREDSYAGRPCQAALVGAAASEGGFKW